MLPVERESKPLLVDDYVWVLDPAAPMAGPVASGDRVIALTAPGCWGPMITPDFASGHEVCQPVRVLGAKPGDAVAIHIEQIKVISSATTSGVHANDSQCMEGVVPFVGKKCPSCRTVNPATYLDGVGQEAIRCRKCGTPVHSCVMTEGYTVSFDEDRRFGVTVDAANAAAIQADAADRLKLPRNSKQYPTNILARGDMPGVVVRVEPMIGNIGTMPSCRVPSCQNSGDIAPRLVGDSHPLRLTTEDLRGISDSHLDDNLVCEGATLICPVHIDGAGVYLGDIHAMQSDGEVAGHTTDVTAQVTIRVELLKGLKLPGPLILPLPEKVPEMIRPLSGCERSRAEQLAGDLGVTAELDSVPLIAVGAAPDIRAAVEQAMHRLASITDLPYDVVRNRVTISGCVEIGRLTGTVHVGMRFPPNGLSHPALRDQLTRKYSSLQG